MTLYNLDWTDDVSKAHKLVRNRARTVYTRLLDRLLAIGAAKTKLEIVTKASDEAENENEPRLLCLVVTGRR